MNEKLKLFLNFFLKLLDPSLFADIDIDELKKSKTFVSMVQGFNKKIKKIEKEAEKVYTPNCWKLTALKFFYFV